MVLKKSNTLLWKKDIKKLVDYYQPKTDKIFSDFNKEVKQRKIVRIEQRNKLWITKYAPRLKKIEVAGDKDYLKIWRNHFGK